MPTSKLTYIWPSRLKILKDEIRKPYFIKLKRFLWEQGVKAPNNSAKSLKIYPSRRYSFSVPWFHTLPGPNSSEHILVVEPHTTRSCQGCHNRSGSLPWTWSSPRYVVQASLPPLTPFLSMLTSGRLVIFRPAGDHYSALFAKRKSHHQYSTFFLVFQSRHYLPPPFCPSMGRLY